MKILEAYLATAQVITVFYTYPKIMGKRSMLCTEGPEKLFAFSFNTTTYRHWIKTEPRHVEPQGQRCHLSGLIQRIRFEVVTTTKAKTCI